MYQPTTPREALDPVLADRLRRHVAALAAGAKRASRAPTTVLNPMPILPDGLRKLIPEA
jgi:hypothetical protein